MLATTIIVIVLGVRKVNTVSSADQIDRLFREGQFISNGICGTVKNNLISQHKLAVVVNGGPTLSSLVGTTLSGQSKSSTDLHFTSKSEEHLDSPNPHRRSRSNSSGPSDVVINRYPLILSKIYKFFHFNTIYLHLR